MEIKFFLFLKMVGMTLFFEVACFGQEMRKKRKRRRRYRRKGRERKESDFEYYL